jgi:hypothetical protein
VCISHTALNSAPRIRDSRSENTRYYKSRSWVRFQVPQVEQDRVSAPFGHHFTQIQLEPWTRWHFAGRYHLNNSTGLPDSLSSVHLPPFGEGRLIRCSALNLEKIDLYNTPVGRQSFAFVRQCA